MKKYVIILLLFPLLVRAEASTEFLADLEKMRTYFEKEKYSLALSYKVYAETSGQLLDNQQGVYEKNTEGYYYKLGDIVIVQNQQWNVYLNDEEKLMAVKENKSASGSSLLSFDEATKGCETITRSEDDKLYTYTITFKSPVSDVYRSVQVVARKSDLKPEKLIFHYEETTTQTDQQGTLINDRLRLEISYGEWGSASNRSTAVSQFFKVDQQKLVPSSAYSDYQLIDQRIQTIK